MGKVVTGTTPTQGARHVTCPQQKKDIPREKDRQGLLKKLDNFSNDPLIRSVVNVRSQKVVNPLFAPKK